MAKEEQDYRVNLKQFLSPVDVENRLGEGDYHAILSTQINVLLIGRSQTGKSTIAYHLADPHCVIRTDGYSTTADPACIPLSLSTSNGEAYYNFNIVDTPGLREKKRNAEEGREDSELLKLATRCVEDNITFINAVCFVSIIGKTHELDVEVFEYVKEFLGPGYSANAMLLLTHCDQVTDDIIASSVRDMNCHEPTKRILDYCKLGVKYFGTMDYAELAKWKHKRAIQEELVVDTLKRVEIWRNDLLNTLVHCPPKAVKQLEAINKFYVGEKEHLNKTLRASIEKEMEDAYSNECAQHEQQIKQWEEEFSNMNKKQEKIEKQMKKLLSNERAQKKEIKKKTEELSSERAHNDLQLKQVEEQSSIELEQKEQQIKQLEEEHSNELARLQKELSNVQSQKEHLQKQEERTRNEKSGCLLM